MYTRLEPRFHIVISMSAYAPDDVFVISLRLFVLVIMTASLCVTNPYPDVRWGLSIESESRAGYWHGCRERGGTKSCVDASLRGASTREQGETCGIKMEANDLGETRVKGPKAGKRRGLSYSR